MRKKFDKIYIVGGGTSLSGFDFSRLADKNTIVINKSIFDVPNSDYFITMDYTFLSKINNKLSIFNSIRTTKVFVADFSSSSMKNINGAIVDTRFNLTYKLDNFDVIVKAYHQKGIGTTFKEFCTGLNSGFCALQLALLLGYKNIYLLGIDLAINNKTHYHEGYNQHIDRFKTSLISYLNNFILGFNQIKEKFPNAHIYSCSSISLLNNIIPFVGLDTI